MGLLLRLCDSFCAADNMLGLFGILKEAATQVLALEHCRLWQVDRKRNVVVCVYHDGDDESMPLIDMKTEDVVGCLQVLNKQDAMGQPVGQSFDDTDLHLAKSFASIVAVGIEQAKFNQASDSAVGMAIKAENKR